MDEAREIVWTPVWDPQRTGQGVELVRFEPAGRARSTAIQFDEAGRPFRMSWRIEWADDWSVRRVRVRTAQAGERRELSLRSSGAGLWTVHGRGRAAELDGCMDVDIWPTPFTNTFPIRRLGDRLVERTEIRVVYIRAPALELEAAHQAYSRVQNGYRFESPAHGFTADLAVDGDGVVLDYPGLFRRLY